MLEAPPIKDTCRECGIEIDLPWGHCADCTAVLLDLQRPERYRLNSPEVLEPLMQRMKRFQDA